MADLYRTTPAGEEREKLTGLFQEAPDSANTIAHLCNQLTVFDLREAAESLGLIEPEEDEDDDTEEDDDDDDDDAEAARPDREYLDRDD